MILSSSTLTEYPLCAIWVYNITPLWFLDLTGLIATAKNSEVNIVNTIVTEENMVQIISW